MMKALLPVFLLAFLAGGPKTTLAQSSNPTAQEAIVGLWKTVDDVEDRVKSIVEITERDGKFYGTVLELFMLPEEDQHPVCDECEDDRKGQPALGMEIVRDMVLTDAEEMEWEDGTICDPKNGKIYTCELWFDGDNYDELKVRGYILFFFRTQTWYRVD
jgi:uncharacterized protein (DUF2147 family)